ncbi:MAG: Rieske 2Fe-2S domain-containing protein [Bacteroidetes bacterium]|nr:Rieske 2Fe-2S domain-containing protein [Bacteroidota bacterium]
MTEKKYTWHKVADYVSELAFGDNQIAVVELKGKKICLGRYREALFAFAYKCPHAGGIMADGYIDALGQVVCPLHRYKFSMANGRNTSGEGYYLKHWPVEIRGDAVYVGQEESGFWNLFGA